jgi:2-dehydro-3-deoxygluconokinase
VAVSEARWFGDLDVIGIGEVMVLLQTREGNDLEEGENLRMLVAGAELNACAAVAALGGSAAILTRFGQDPFAHRIERRAHELGVGLLYECDPTRPTGVFFKETTSGDERRVYYYRSGSAASAMDRSTLEMLGEAHPRAFLVSGLTAALGDGPAALLLAAAAAARRLDIRFAVDANLRPALGHLDRSVRTLNALLEYSSLLVIGTDEGDALFGTSDPQDIMTSARAAGCREIVVKAGAEGAFWMDDDGSAHHVASFAARVVDPVGAGDAFTGAYLWARQNGYTPRDATLIGSRLAARIVAVRGDTEGLPGPQEMASLLGDLRPQVESWV